MGEGAGGRLSRWEVLGLVAGLSGYVYVLGGIVTWARFSAAGVAADQAVALLNDRVLFAVGLRAVLVVTLMVVGLLLLAAIAGRRGWQGHEQGWRDVPTVQTRGDDRFARLAAGVNAVVVSAVFAIAAGGAASQFSWSPDVNDLVITIVVVVVFTALCAGFVRFGPWLLAGRRRWVTTGVLAATALVSALPIALLVVVGTLLTLLARAAPERDPGSVVAALRTRLPYLLAAVYALVAFAWESIPPVSYPRASVTTAAGTTVGGYVGRTDDGVYLLTCRGDLRGHSAEAALVVVPKEGITSMRIGGRAYRVDSGARPSPLERVAHAIGVTDRDLTWISPEAPDDTPTCGADEAGTDTTGLGANVIVDPRARTTVRVPSTEPLLRDDGTPRVVADLLRRFQPTVEVTVEDRFWPVAVSTVLQEKGRRGATTCLHADDTCTPAVRLSDLDAGGAKDDYLDLPEPLESDPTAQFTAYMRGQGIDPRTALDRLEREPAALDPWRSAQVYGYFAGRVSAPDYYRDVPVGLYALQYWLFYPYNYFPLEVNPARMASQPIAATRRSADQHEGDWEQVTVFLDDELTARYLYMARHDGEGVAVPWDRVRLDRPTHPIVQPAFGGHPSYPNDCGRFPRAVLGGNLSDYVSCGSGRFAFRARTTALANLARTGWACWPGHFGEATAAELANAGRSEVDPRHHIKVAGPRSPLWQAPNAGVCDRDPLAAETAFAASAAGRAGSP